MKLYPGQKSTRSWLPDSTRRKTSSDMVHHMGTCWSRSCESPFAHLYHLAQISIILLLPQGPLLTVTKLAVQAHAHQPFRVYTQLQAHLSSLHLHSLAGSPHPHIPNPHFPWTEPSFLQHWKLSRETWSLFPHLSPKTHTAMYRMAWQITDQALKASHSIKGTLWTTEPQPRVLA